MTTRTEKKSGRKLCITLGIAVMIVPLFLTGCMSFNPKSMRTVKSALLEDNPELEISSGFSFAVGALTIDFIDMAFVHDKALDVSKISRAEIGVYELAGEVVLADFELPDRAFSDRRCPQRDVIVKVREDDEYVQIAACIRNEKVTSLSVVVLEPKEIVVLQARGNFESLISSLVKYSTRRDGEMSIVSI